jgi:hypothetical protein
LVAVTRVYLLAISHGLTSGVIVVILKALKTNTFPAHDSVHQILEVLDRILAVRFDLVHRDYEVRSIPNIHLAAVSVAVIVLVAAVAGVHVDGCSSQ